MGVVQLIILQNQKSYFSQNNITLLCIKKSGPQSKGFKVYITLMCTQAGILIETKREFNKTKCDPYHVVAIRMPL